MMALLELPQIGDPWKGSLGTCFFSWNLFATHQCIQNLLQTPSKLVTKIGLHKCVWLIFNEFVKLHDVF